MIVTDIKGSVQCDADGCKAYVSGKLRLMPTGGFAFLTDITNGCKDWKINLHPVGGFAAYCPVHGDKVPQIDMSAAQQKGNLVIQ